MFLIQASNIEILCRNILIFTKFTLAVLKIRMQPWIYKEMLSILFVLKQALGKYEAMLDRQRKGERPMY